MTGRWRSQTQVQISWEDRTQKHPAPKSLELFSIQDRNPSGRLQPSLQLRVACADFWRGGRTSGQLHAENLDNLSAFRLATVGSSSRQMVPDLGKLSELSSPVTSHNLATLAPDLRILFSGPHPHIKCSPLFLDPMTCFRRQDVNLVSEQRIKREGLK
jgi:hypothetical protein